MENRNSQFVPGGIFLCYRKNTAQTALAFKDAMEQDHEYAYGSIWYSNLQPKGNYLKIEEQIHKSRMIIFFVGETFTGGFLDERYETRPKCVTARELVYIEKKKKKREGTDYPLELMSINIDGHSLSETQCETDLRHLFRNAGILRSEDDLETYTALNINPFDTTRDIARKYLKDYIAKACALKQKEPRFSKAFVLAEENAKSGQILAGRKNQQSGADIVNTTLAKYGDMPVGEFIARNGETWQRAETRLSERNSVISSAPVTAIYGTLRQSAEQDQNGKNYWFFGSYPQGRNGEIGPIQWLELKREGELLLLISRFVLDAKPYNEEWKAITWAESSLRQWLNGRRKDDFPQIAFSAEEWEQICFSAILPSGNPSFSTDPGVGTTDKVFLLSIQDVVDSGLFASDEARRCAPTVYKKKKAWTSDEFIVDGTAACLWWLRSPGGISNTASNVNHDGTVGVIGLNVHSGWVGVRPAIWVKLKG